MARKTSSKQTKKAKQDILHTAALLFLQKGYTDTSLREIARMAEVNIGSLMYLFESKENILCELVGYVLNGQFTAADRMLKGITEDRTLFWAVETTLQLYMTESSEKVRELYIAAYSHPKSSAIISHVIADKLSEYFREYNPGYEAKDFYELEIASGGIIRGFMTVPCDMYFTMERKIRRYLETSFRVYNIPEDKTKEAIAFVSKFDFAEIAQKTVDHMVMELKTTDHLLDVNE